MIPQFKPTTPNLQSGKLNTLQASSSDVEPIYAKILTKLRPFITWSVHVHHTCVLHYTNRSESSIKKVPLKLVSSMSYVILDRESIIHHILFPITNQSYQSCPSKTLLTIFNAGDQKKMNW